MGWSQSWAKRLKNAQVFHKCEPSLLDIDYVFIDHGVNYSGAMNLFGGLTTEIYNNVNMLMACRKVMSLDHEMPNWGEQFRKRINANSTCDEITEEWCDKVSDWCTWVMPIWMHQLGLDHAIIGDSHCPAFAADDDAIFKKDGRTLFGCLKSGFDEIIPKNIIKRRITYCLGSIDIRHHIHRHDTDIDNLVRRYVSEGSKYGNEQYYCAPVPVEYEARRLPKTGYYKGTPFFGSREARAATTQQFIESLKKYAGPEFVIMPPAHWYTMDPEQYAKTYMEYGSSVHMAPPYYRSNNFGESLFF